MSSISLNGDTSGAILLQAPAIAGSTTLTLPTGTATLAINGPAFSAYLGSTQTIPHATNTKLQFSAELFDTASCFDTSTYRFTPTVAGYYQINVIYILQAPSGRTYEVVAKLYKNGSSYLENYNSFVMSTGTTMSMPLSAVVYMNGSTDYLEMYTNNYDYTASSTMSALGSYSGYSNFSGSLVRGA
jgi:hypothetical protein